MSELVVVQEKRGFFSRVGTSFKNSAAAVVVATATAFGVAVPTIAMAAPDTAELVAAIGGVETTIDAVGGGMVTIFVGLMVFGIIIGMIARKGK